MSITQTHQEIINTIEDDSRYKKGIGKIQEEIVASNKSYVIAVLDVANTAFSDERFKPKSKYMALRLLKDCMHTGSHMFALALAKCEVSGCLEQLGQLPPSKISIENILLVMYLDLSKDYDFHGLLLDCISLWGKKYKDTKDQTHKYAEILERLTSSGVKFKTTYSVLSKDEVKKYNALQIPSKAFVEVKADNLTTPSPSSNPKSPSPDSIQRVNSLGKGDWKPSPEMQNLINKHRRQYEEVMQATFFYNAQELKEDPSAPPSTVDRKPNLGVIVEDAEEHSQQTKPKDNPIAKKLNEEVYKFDEASTKESRKNSGSLNTPQIVISKPIEDLSLSDQPTVSFPPNSGQLSDRSNRSMDKSNGNIQINDKTVELKEKLSIEMEARRALENRVIEMHQQNENLSKSNTQLQLELSREIEKNKKLGEETAKIDVSQSENTDLKRKLNEYRSKLQDTQQKLIESQQKLTETQVKLEMEQTNTTNLTAQLNSKDQEINSKVKSIKFEFDAIQQTLAVEMRKNEDLRKKLDEAEKDNNDLRMRLEEKDTHQHLGESELAKENEKLRGNIRELRDKLQERKKHTSLLETRIQELQAEIDSKELLHKNTLDQQKQTLEAQFQAREKELQEALEHKDNQMTLKIKEIELNLKKEYLAREKDREKDSKDSSIREVQESDFKQHRPRVLSLADVDPTEEVKDIMRPPSISRNSYEDNKSDYGSIEGDKSHNSTIVIKKERVNNPFSRPISLKSAQTYRTGFRRYNGVTIRTGSSTPHDNTGHMSPGEFLRKSLDMGNFHEDYRDMVITSPSTTVTNATDEYHDHPEFRRTFDTMPKSTLYFSPPHSTKFFDPKSLVQSVYLSPGPRSHGADTPPRAFEPIYKPLIFTDMIPDKTHPEKFQQACTVDQALLFEDDHVSVNCRFSLHALNDGTEYESKIDFIFVNKTNRVLEDFEVTYKNIPGFKLAANGDDLLPEIGPHQKQIHSLVAKMISTQQGFGFIVLTYSLDNKRIELKVKSPLTILKFMNFKSISGGEFMSKRKTFLAQRPNNSLDTEKIKISPQNFINLKNSIFSKLTVIPIEGKKNNRFLLLGGVCTIDESPNEFLLRVIIENETRLALFQLSFEDEYRKYADRILKMLSFVTNERIVQNELQNLHSIL